MSKMKIVVIAVVILLVLFVTVQLFAMSNRKNIESYSYTVVKTYNEFEIRLYEAALFTSVNIPSSNYNDASSQGFSILAGYIFGKNDRKEKISMTSPVAMTLDDTITIMFMVPKKFNKDSLPKPDESSSFHSRPRCNEMTENDLSIFDVCTNVPAFIVYF